MIVLGARSRQSISKAHSILPFRSRRFSLMSLENRKVTPGRNVQAVANFRFEGASSVPTVRSATVRRKQIAKQGGRFPTPGPRDQLPTKEPMLA